MSLKKICTAVGVAIMLAVALPLCAQTGCTDSPEDPTIVLGLVGSAGALAAAIWKSHRRF